MFTIFENIFEKGVQLLEERRVRRRNFFDEIIQPTHALFLQFERDHLATFREIIAIASDPLRSLSEAIELLEEKSSFERGDWMMFELLEQLAVESKSKLGSAYSAYIGTLRECLSQARPSDPSGIVYYNNLRYDLSVALLASKISDRSARSDSVKRIKSTLQKFQQYCARVKLAYLALRAIAFVT